MMKSMTGFGRGELEKFQKRFSIEMKSVNHRYLDINIRLPRKLNFLENQVRRRLKECLQRGKVDVFIGYEDLSESTMSVKYNPSIAKEYYDHLMEMAEAFQLEKDVRVSTLSRYPEVFTMEEQSIDEESLWEGLKECLQLALTQFIQTRRKEGEALQMDLFDKLGYMEELVSKVEERSPQILSEYREKLEEKARELLENTQIEESRVLQEVLLFSDRICTDEEVVRLKSHIIHMKETLQSQEEGVGRKLDFIAQEMNREANTILSKSNDLKTSNLGIELKTEIEKIREQIQNIE